MLFRSPSLTLTHDEDKDVVKAVIDNKGQNFQSDRIFIFDMRVKTEGTIAPGAQYTNKATVDAEQRTATAVKNVSGGGTGSGDEVYYLPADDLYLVGTSEVALAGYHQGEIIDLSAGNFPEG